MVLESYCHPISRFVTLTYAPESLPAHGTLLPKDVQLWLKRLRKKISVPVRYYLVGEYGEKSELPHYHVALFGSDAQLCVGCRNEYARGRRKCDCLIRESWGIGHVFVGDMTFESANYIAQYVTKKMTSKDDIRLKGRHPEFARMSLRPGIGAGTVPDIAKSLNSMFAMQDVCDTGDVPISLKQGKKSFPLGRYIRSKLREEVGLDAEKVKEGLMLRWSAEMAEKLEESISAAREQGEPSKSLFRIVVEEHEQVVEKMKFRSKLREGRRYI